MRGARQGLRTLLPIRNFTASLFTSPFSGSGNGEGDGLDRPGSIQGDQDHCWAVASRGPLVRKFQMLPRYSAKAKGWQCSNLQLPSRQSSVGESLSRRRMKRKCLSQNAYCSPLTRLWNLNGLSGRRRQNVHLVRIRAHQSTEAEQIGRQG